MISNQFRRLLIKYTLLLSILYFLSFGFKKLMSEVEEDIIDGDYVFHWAIAAFVFEVLINVITAYMISLDTKKFQIRTKYVILATILYRPIGVVAFLLFTMLQYKEQIINTDEA